jgi:hypothetical protein
LLPFADPALPFDNPMPLSDAPSLPFGDPVLLPDNRSPPIGDPMLPPDELSLSSDDRWLWSDDRTPTKCAGCWFEPVEASSTWPGRVDAAESRLPISACGIDWVMGLVLTEVVELVVAMIEGTDSSGRNSGAAATPVINPVDRCVRFSIGSSWN